MVGVKGKLLLRHSFVLAALAVALCPGLARAATADTARQQLIEANLKPRPLYPAILPDPIGDETESVFGHGRHTFSVTYRCRCDLSDSSYYSVILTFNRAPASQLGQTIYFLQHVQRHPVRRVRIDGRNTYRMQSDTGFGYAWRDRGYAYFVTAHDSTQVGWGFVRAFVDALAPLGRELTGRTSQNRWVSLYESSYGIDYNVHYDETCDDGASTTDEFQEGLVSVDRQRAFAQHLNYTYTDNDGSDHRVTGDFDGSIDLNARSARGAFSESDANPDLPETCQSGAVSWSVGS